MFPQLPAREERRRRAAHRASESDRDAAARLGLPRMTYTMWRRRRGLPPKGVGRPAKPRLSKSEVARRLRIIQESKWVAAAAKRMGLDVGSVYRFLRKHAVTTPYRLRMDRRHAEWVRQLRQGKTVRQVAQANGVKYYAVHRIAKAAGIRFRRRRRPKPKRSSRA